MNNEVTHRLENKNKFIKRLNKEKNSEFLMVIKSFNFNLLSVFFGF
jgi:hypothetical protein